MIKSSRRRFLTQTTGALTGAALAASMETRFATANSLTQEAEQQTKKNVNHSVCKWCYGSISLEELCTAGKEFGLQSIELLQPADMEILKKHGMTCAIATNPQTEAADGKIVGGINRGWNRPEYHDVLVEAFKKQITDAHNAGIKNVICFSGNREGMDDELGMKNCAEGVKKLMPLCEQLGMTLTMELLNSKAGGHVDYMCDHTEWGVGLCELVGNENFKLLYDIFHMQIMEGDVISTIRKHHKLISHYHTGGVPGRNEIDESQELYYPAIIRAILETGYEGFIGQEFIPKREDKIASLKQGVTICDV